MRRYADSWATSSIALTAARIFKPFASEARLNAYLAHYRAWLNVLRLPLGDEVDRYAFTVLQYFDIASTFPAFFLIAKFKTSNCCGQRNLPTKFVRRTGGVDRRTGGVDRWCGPGASRRLLFKVVSLPGVVPYEYRKIFGKLFMYEVVQNNVWQVEG